MLFHAKTLEGLTIQADDGDVGELEDLFFDDETWCVRYLVVDTNKWLPGGKVLVAPDAFKAVRWDEPSVRVNMTRDQIEYCPDIDTHKPISRKTESTYRNFFGWPLYWGGFPAYGAEPFPGAAAGLNRPPIPVRPEQDANAPETTGLASDGDDSQEESHLWSVSDLRGYTVKARYRNVGQVKDVILDSAGLALRYLVVATGTLLTGKLVLIDVSWTFAPSWEEQLITADLSPDNIETAPEHDGKSPVTRDTEEKLYRHFEREPYWET